MEVTQQNPTLTATPSGIAPTPVSAGQPPLKWQWQYYIDWCATGGLRVTEAGDIEQLSATQLARDLGVNRSTLYDWPKIIPQFAMRVGARQKEIYAAGGARANNIWKALTLRAMRGEKPQAEMVLSHFAGYTPPAQKHEVQINGLADLANLARKNGIVEGEVVEVEPTQLPQEASSGN